MLRAGNGLSVVCWLASATVLGAPVAVSEYVGFLSAGTVDVFRDRTHAAMGFRPTRTLHTQPLPFAGMKSSSAPTPQPVQRMRCLRDTCPNFHPRTGLVDRSSKGILPRRRLRCCWTEHDSVTSEATSRAASTRNNRDSTQHAEYWLQRQTRSGHPDTHHRDKTMGEGPLACSANGGRDASPSSVLYFAYGANMSPAILTTKRGVRPLASVPAEAVSLNGQDIETETLAGQPGSLAPRVDDGVFLCFCHRSGFATLALPPGPHQDWEISPGVHGVLHSISPSDMERMENAETGYRRCTVVVETYEGTQNCAECFISDPMQVLPTSVPPTSRYLSLLRDGASYHGLNDSYQSWLAALPSVQSKDAEMSPERTNTPAKRALNNGLTAIGVLTLLAAAHILFGSW